MFLLQDGDYEQMDAKSTPQVQRHSKPNVLQTCTSKQVFKSYRSLPALPGVTLLLLLKYKNLFIDLRIYYINVITSGKPGLCRSKPCFPRYALSLYCIYILKKMIVFNCAQKPGPCNCIKSLSGYFVYSGQSRLTL